MTLGLHLDIDGTVATLAIDRAERRNALTQEMWAAIPRLVADAVATPSLRVLIVTSAVPGVFSAGADVGEYRANAGDIAWGEASQRRVANALAALRAIPFPTLAVVDGPCIGGGAGLALACDVRLASDTATFGIPPARLGLVFPFEDVAALVGLVGPASARRILFTGAPFDAAHAARIGFVDEVYPVADLQTEANALVSQITSASPGSIRSMKKMISMVEAGQRDGDATTDGFVTAALESADHREGVHAFLERRSPVFGIG